MLNVKNISSWWFFWAILQVLCPASLSASWWSSCGQWRLFCFSPVIACLFFVAGLLSMLEMQVSPWSYYWDAALPVDAVHVFVFGWEMAVWYSFVLCPKNLVMWWTNLNSIGNSCVPFIIYLPVQSSLVWSLEYYLAKSPNYKTTYYANNM
jgi:hypothetical protein